MTGDIDGHRNVDSSVHKTYSFDKVDETWYNGCPVFSRTHKRIRLVQMLRKIVVIKAGV